MIIIDIDIPYLNIVGLQTKGKFACLVCGPKMNYSFSKYLGKMVLDEYRHFLSKTHRFCTTEKTSFQWERRDWIKTMKNDTSPMEFGV